MLALYYTKWFAENKNHLLFSVALGTLAGSYLIFVIWSIVISIIINNISFSFFDIAFDIAIVVMLVLMIISVLHGKKGKALIITAFVIVCVDSLMRMIDWLTSLHYYWSVFSLLESLFGILFDVTVFISLLLFLLNNRVPAVIHANPANLTSTKSGYTPEDALRELRDQLDAGLISEEAYQQARAEIISKL